MSIAAIVGGTIASTAGNVAGAVAGQPDAGPPPAVGFLPASDPVLGTLGQEGLLGLGRYDPFLVSQTSPTAQFISQMNTQPPGLISDEDKRTAAVALARIQTRPEVMTNYLQLVSSGQIPSDGASAIKYLQGVPNLFFAPGGGQERGDGSGEIEESGDGQLLLNGLARAMAATGTTLSALSQAELQFQAENQFSQRRAEIARQVAEGRLDAQEATAALTSELAGLADITSVADLNRNRFTSALEARLTDQFERARREVLDFSAISGTNPGTELEKLTSSFNLERNEIPRNAAEEVLTLLAGQQQALEPAQSLASTISELRTQRESNAASIGANQAIANQQAITGTNTTGAENFGQGLTSAFTGLSNALLKFGGGPGGDRNIGLGTPGRGPIGGP